MLSTEKLNKHEGKTHSGQELTDTKLLLNPEGKIHDHTLLFLHPKDCVREQKEVISGILKKHRNPKPKQRATLWKCLWINTEGK